MTSARAGRWLTVLAAAMLALGVPTGAAWAHSSEISTTPSAGDVLDAAPSEVRVEFDSDLLDMGAAIVVRDAAGASVVVGEPEVGRRSLSVPVDPTARPGDYQVAYRVVSEDGHTIESTFEYMVAGGSGTVAASPTTTRAAPASPAESQPAESEPAQSAAAVSSPAEPGTSTPLPWIVAGGAVVLILGIGGALALRR
jgi:methionine-rich copper-binding protein CopC